MKRRHALLGARAHLHDHVRKLLKIVLVVVACVSLGAWVLAGGWIHSIVDGVSGWGAAALPRCHAQRLTRDGCGYLKTASSSIRLPDPQSGNPHVDCLGLTYIGY